MDKQLDKKITEFLEKNRENFIKDLRGLLKYNSVREDASEGMPYGKKNAEALDYMIELCSSSGLECDNLDYYAMDATYGEGDEVVASLTHLDIVPIGDDWEHDPLAGEIEDGLIYGRGTLDDKGPSIAALYAVKALIDADATLKRKIRLIFGCDEESGMSDMTYYLEKKKAPEYGFSPDAYFPCIHAEKSVLMGEYTKDVKGESRVKKIEGGTRTNVVPDSASAYLTSIGCYHNDPNIIIEEADGLYKVMAKGVSAHASTPNEGSNAIIILAKYLARILPDSDPYKSVLRTVYQSFEATDGCGLGVKCTDKPTGPLTLNLGVIEGTQNKLIVKFDIRNPVTFSAEVTHHRLQSAIQGFKLTDYHCSEGLYVEKDHELVKTLQGIYHEITGDKSDAIAIGGGTYARTLPCAVAFGPAFKNSKSKGAHMHDECASLDELISGARIYAHAFYELANL